MKKIFIILTILLFAANCCLSQCVITGGACSIDNIRDKNNKITNKKLKNTKKIKKKLTNKNKKNKKEYNKK